MQHSINNTTSKPSKFPSMMPWSIYDYTHLFFRTQFFSPVLTAIILTTALSSLQIGIITLIVLSFYGFSFILSMMVAIAILFIYGIIVHAITNMTWRFIETWHFDILGELYPEFYTEMHPIQLHMEVIKIEKMYFDAIGLIENGDKKKGASMLKDAESQLNCMKGTPTYREKKIRKKLSKELMEHDATFSHTIKCNPPHNLNPGKGIGGEIII